MHKNCFLTFTGTVILRSLPKGHLGVVELLLLFPHCLGQELYCSRVADTLKGRRDNMLEPRQNLRVNVLLKELKISPAKLEKKLSGDWAVDMHILALPGGLHF